MVEFRKLIENQTLMLLAQQTILEKLTNLELDTISNSGLNEGECEPCPTTETIQSSNQLEPELIVLNQKLQGILDRLNMMQNPYRSIILNTEEINDGLNKIKKDLTKFSEKFNFFSQINDQMEHLTDIFEEYKIIYIIYTTLAAVLLLVLIKVLAFLFYLLSLCKNCCQVFKDFQEFRTRLKEERQPPRHQDEIPYPLVSYRR